MVDLHSHILPGIDDGAKTMDESRQLLAKQQADGVQAVALTPHFNFERQSLPEFLEQRGETYQLFKEVVQAEFPQMAVRLAAEVFFSPKLLEQDMTPLCYEGTSYLLVEFPMTYYPKWAPDVFYNLQLAGITPVIAHVERYPFVMQDLSLLYDWVNAGAVTHVNATSLVKHKKRRKIIELMIKHNLVHTIATDAHSMKKRPPELKAAYHLVEAKFGSGKIAQMKQVADDVLSNLAIEAGEASEIRKLLGFMF